MLRYRDLIEEDKLLKEGYKKFLHEKAFYFKIVSYQDDLNNPCYIAMIYLLEKIKISNYYIVFQIQKTCEEIIVNYSKEANSANVSVFTIINLSRGIAFIPDIKIITLAKIRRKSLKGISPKGIALVLPNKFNKAKLFLKAVIKILAKDEKIYVVSLEDEALKLGKRNLSQ